MQQAARVSDYTAFMYLGELIEFDDTNKIFTIAERPAHPGLHHRPFRLTRRRRRHATWSEHTVKAFDSDLQELDAGMVAEMGGLAEQHDRRFRRRADPPRRRAGASASSPPTPKSTRCSTRSRSSAVLDHRPAPADGGRPARDRRRHARRHRSRAHRRSRQEHRQARRRRSTSDFQPLKLIRGLEHMTDLVQSQVKAVLDAYARATICRRRWRCGSGDEEIDAHLHLAVPRTAHLHDGRSAQHHASAPICCSAPRTSSGSATTPPTSPRPSIYMIEGQPIADKRPKGDTTTPRRADCTRAS